MDKKPWIIRPMTPGEVEQEPAAFARTDRESREVTYDPAGLGTRAFP